LSRLIIRGKYFPFVNELIAAIENKSMFDLECNVGLPIINYLGQTIKGEEINLLQ